MRGASGSGRGGGGDGSDSDILRQYYSESDYLTSPEGIVRLVSIVLCISLSGLLLSGGCGTRGALGAAGGALELAGAAALAGLGAARLLRLAHCAPVAYLFAELVVSAAVGGLLLAAALLALALCAPTTPVHYVHGVLGLATGGLVFGGAAVTHAAATRRWDAARAQPPSPRDPPAELDV